MSSMFESFRGKQSLPVSQPDGAAAATATAGIRRRLSSLNFQQPSINFSYPAATASWAFSRSKSAGNSIREWWEWGWTWILSRKLAIIEDLEMNQEETIVLGCQNKGSLGHVFYKLRSQFRKLVRSNNVALPQTFRYDYPKN